MTAEPPTIEAALFPIPNAVAFPGTVMPLHVFEPRYRRLVHESVEHDRMVAVCHTQKIISVARQDQTLEQALSSNQATYQPREIFSAGPCKIIETTSDGRIMVEIRLSHRLKLTGEVQSLPYRIATCELVKDEDLTRYIL